MGSTPVEHTDDSLNELKHGFGAPVASPTKPNGGEPARLFSVRHHLSVGPNPSCVTEHLFISLGVALSSHRRLIAHADMDAFYAAAEQLDDPSLRGLPVLIGGRSGRGVVLTCSYEARVFGIHSAMPMGRALRLCPDAICVPPRFERYTELSRAIMTAFRTFSPKVEPISLDEAFIDLTGTQHLFGEAAEVGAKIKAAVFEATQGLTASVGVSGTKYVAKVASDYDKPDGLTIVPHETAREWLAPQDVRRLWGAGPKTCERMYALGIMTIGDLARADIHWLRAELGSGGAHFKQLAMAVDPRPVVAWSGRKSVGSDRTLATDVRAVEDIQRHLRRASDEIARRLRNKDLRAHGVRVRLKTSSFKLKTRQARLSNATNVSARLYEMAATLLDRFEHREAYRLVGMAAYDLTEELPCQLDCLDVADRDYRLESTLDRVAAKFGAGIVLRAENLVDGTGMRMAPNLDFLSTAMPYSDGDG